MDFDKYFKAKFKDLHEAVCCGDLVAANYKKAIKKGFKAGQQSKQEEIDALQKRIDEALKYVSESPLKDVSRKAMINFLDILKGKQNER